MPAPRVPRKPYQAMDDDQHVDAQSRSDIPHQSSIEGVRHVVPAQRVFVKIRDKLWVVGVLIATLEVFHRITGIAYEVEYQHPDSAMLRRAFFVREDVDLGHHHGR